MAERAAHLVDGVFADVPIRQWVLSLPHRLRYVLAWDHALCRASSSGRCSGFCGAARGRPVYPVDAAGPWRSFSASAPR
jgi:hypothetical protein